MTVEADEIVVSALCDRSRIAPWGLFGGGEGETTAFLLRRAEAEEFAHVLGGRRDRRATRSSPTCACARGDQVLLRSPSGGGYGPPHERDPERVAADVREGFVTRRARARERYGVALTADGAVDAAATARLRGEGA